MPRRVAKPAALLLALLAMAMALPGGGAAEPYTGRYVAGATPFSPQIGCLGQPDAPIACAVAGVILCQPGLGGACTPVVAQEGSTLVAQVADDVATRLSWAVCIDGDGDAICRPERANGPWPDTIQISTCAQGQGSLEVTNNGRSGYVYVFIMVETGAGPDCTPVTGRVSVSVITPQPPECSDGRDNDGDGAFDYPLDSDCTSPFDPSERPPPPPYTAH